jgi:autotransporter-associated beta strand protein
VIIQPKRIITMKTILRNFQTLLIFSAMVAMPRLASAAQKTFAQVTPSPASASVIVGVATTNTSIVTVENGSGSSARFVGTALITVTVTNPDPSVVVSISPTNLVFPGADTFLTSTVTVTTTVSTPANTYGVQIVADTNNPPQANITPKTNFYTLNVSAGAPFVPQKIWSPAGANTNWSTAGNWTNSGVPTPSNDVIFINLGATNAGTVDNVVDSSLTIGSLTYGQTNLFHKTLIPSGVTLTVGGTANGLVAGTGTDGGTSPTSASGYVTSNSITGAGGTLSITNRNANVSVSESHNTSDNLVSQAQAALDLSGLDTFNATVARVLVGVDLNINLRGASGILNLAKTNTITATPGSAAPQIDVGDNSQAGGTPTIPSVLLLGQTNGIFADSIAVGRGKTDSNGALLAFNSAFSSPTAYFRGTNGASSRVGTWFIGDGYGSRTTFVYGTCDFSLGTVNALVDTMYVGRGASSALGSGTTLFDPGIGTLTFNSGTIDVNTLNVGYSTADAPGFGTVNANGGSLLVNTLFELSYGSGASGTLNISNATVTANTGITVAGAGLYSATINMTGGTLNVTNASATIGTTANPLNTFSAANATLKLAANNLVPTIVTANLAAGGTANTINISSVSVLNGFPTQFPIIRYGLNGGSGSGMSTFVLGTLPSASPPYGAYISNNVTSKSIDIVFTNGPFVPALTWDGKTNGNWDVATTANWRPMSGPDTTFGQGNIVTFDDTLTGTTNVNLMTALAPGALTVNNTNVNYVFSGGGSITGSVTLVKSGSGTLTLTETGGDNFSSGIIVNNGKVILGNANSAISGGTTINGGTIQVGNNDVNGTLPLGNVTDSGALIFNRADNIIVTNVISGVGTLTQNGTNVVTLSGNNNGFTGTATVGQGTLQVGSTNALGSATSVTVSNAATFDVNGYALFGNGNAGLVVTVSGPGVGGNGAIVNNSPDTNSPTTQIFHMVTLAADATFGGNSDWDIRNSSGKSSTADAALNGAFNLTKVGTNSVTLRGVTVDAGLGNINVQAGSLSFTATATAPQNSLGDASKTATVFSNATLTLDSIGIVPGKNFVLTNGGTLRCSGTNTLKSPLTLAACVTNNNNTISVGNGAQFTITSAIGGVGGFSKNGVGTLFLTASNTYSGRTVVSGGTLALYGGGSNGAINFSTNININAGATLDVSGRSDKTLTLTSVQTLVGGDGTNGPGTINGLLLVSSGATVAPGGTTTNVIGVTTGTLSVISNATLSGATLMKISATNGNDQIDAWSITYGGTLVVTNFSGLVTNGQSFQLFVATNGYSLNFSSVTLPSATGLTWTNTLTTNGRITAGVVPPAQPSITSISLSGTSLVISGTGGTATYQFVLLTSTNLTLPLSQWTPVVTSTFTGGSWSTTNTVNPSAPQNFYLLDVLY